MASRKPSPSRARSTDAPAPDGRVLMVHPDLPGVARAMTPSVARVFAKSGWTPSKPTTSTTED